MELKLAFEASVYSQRRQILRQDLASHQNIVLFGHDESSSNFKDNWYPFRQDSSFLYFTGISHVASLVLVLDAQGQDILFGDDLSIDDIVWTGPQPSLNELAALAGISKVLPLAEISKYLNPEVLFLPIYRPEHKLKLIEWAHMPAQDVEHKSSVALVKAIAKQRSIKSAQEIAYIDQASTITSRMHRAVITGAKEGMYEYEVAALGQKVLWENAALNSFLPIVTINGNILHNHSYDNKFTEGKMLLFDSGAELKNGYCGDMTRTIPSGRKFSSQQKELYDTVYAAHTHAISLLKPGVAYRDIHLAACTKLVEGLSAVGLMKGDPAEAVANGAHAMFFQCGLGHMMGLDVHDMENLGEQYIGYTDDLKKSTQFGLKSLRMGKALEIGHVITVEPGIYIIPELIDMWKAKNLHSDFINYPLLETYKNFGGIRVEEAYHITETGAGLLGEHLAISSHDVEALRP
jgi:Xaa-Pro aminopeptidase